jgi:hypothetical protein
MVGFRSGGRLVRSGRHRTTSSDDLTITPHDRKITLSGSVAARTICGRIRPDPCRDRGDHEIS